MRLRNDCLENHGRASPKLFPFGRKPPLPHLLSCGGDGVFDVRVPSSSHKGVCRKEKKKYKIQPEDLDRLGRIELFRTPSIITEEP